MLYHSGCSQFNIYFYLSWSVFDTPSFLTDGDISVTIQSSVSQKCSWLNVIMKVMAIVLVKVKVKFILEQATKAQRGSRCITVLLLKLWR